MTPEFGTVTIRPPLVDVHTHEPETPLHFLALLGETGKPVPAMSKVAVPTPVKKSLVVLDWEFPIITVVPPDAESQMVEAPDDESIAITPDVYILEQAALAQATTVKVPGAHAEPVQELWRNSR